jgi:hypothetical protein
MTWQPIDTAPNDENVLVFVPPDDDEGSGIMGVARFHRYARGDGGWWQWDSEYWPVDISPTHWMPLPEPPQAVDAVARGAAHEHEPATREKV